MPKRFEQETNQLDTSFKPLRKQDRVVPICRKTH